MIDKTRKGVGLEAEDISAHRTPRPTNRYKELQAARWLHCDGTVYEAREDGATEMTGESGAD